LIGAIVLSALVAVAQHPTTYNVYIRPRYQAFGYAGTLTLTFQGNRVRGTYRDADTAIARTVSGRLDGRRISLEVPTLGRLYVDGTVESNGDIDGYGTSTSAGTLYVFTASREPASP
jgi:hypothetical protein